LPALSGPKENRKMMNVDQTRTLLLSQSYEPIKIISWQRAMTLLLLDKVEVVEEYDTEIRGTSLKGEVQVDWRDAQSALSTVVPLGTYRLTVKVSGGIPAIDLRTLAGPLQMQGKGTVEGSRIRFNGIATAEPSMLGALNGLLGLLGMRSGDKVLLAIST